MGQSRYALGVLPDRSVQNDFAIEVLAELLNVSLSPTAVVLEEASPGLLVEAAIVQYSSKEGKRLPPAIQIAGVGRDVRVVSTLAAEASIPHIVVQWPASQEASWSRGRRGEFCSSLEAFFVTTGTSVVIVGSELSDYLVPRLLVHVSCVDIATRLSLGRRELVEEVWVADPNCLVQVEDAALDESAASDGFLKYKVRWQE